jgi:hypothetical protein
MSVTYKHSVLAVTPYTVPEITSLQSIIVCPQT